MCAHRGVSAFSLRHFHECLSCKTTTRRKREPGEFSGFYLQACFLWWRDHILLQQIMRKKPVPCKPCKSELYFTLIQRRKAETQSRFFQENHLLHEGNLSWSYLCPTLALSHHLWCLLWFPIAFTLCYHTNTSKRGHAAGPTGIHPLGGRAWSKGARLGKFCTIIVPQSEATNQPKLLFFSTSITCFYNIKCTADLNFVLKNYQQANVKSSSSFFFW